MIVSSLVDVSIACDCNFREVHIICFQCQIRCELIGGTSTVWVHCDLDITFKCWVALYACVLDESTNHNINYIHLSSNSFLYK